MREVQKQIVFDNDVPIVIEVIGDKQKNETDASRHSPERRSVVYHSGCLWNIDLWNIRHQREGGNTRKQIDQRDL